MATKMQHEINVEDIFGFIKQVGKGSYGDAWLVVPLKTIENGKLCVLKRLALQSITKDEQEAAEREATLLSTLKHPNIVAYVASFRSSDSYLNIVMYYCEGGDLYTKIRKKISEHQKFEEAKIIEWYIQICMALQYIHERHILHRDLKTQNLFLTKDEIIKVGDFGISRVLEGADDLATTIIGTPYYMSPEMLSNKPYDQKSDIWSLGCCMYELVQLNTAFNAKDMNSLVLKIIGGTTPEIRGNYSDELKKMITAMLSKEPHHRPTAKQFLQNSYIRHHITRLLEDTKRRIQNKTQSNMRSTCSLSTLPAEPEFASVSPRNNTITTSTIDLRVSESRMRRRQKIASQQQSAFHTMAEPTTAIAINDNGLLSDIDEPEVWKRCPVEKLTYYFEQHEKEDEEDYCHFQIKNEFTSTLNSSTDTINVKAQQEATSTVKYQPKIAVAAKTPVEEQNKMNYRYFDIGTLPHQTLLPITGYNNEPLTSLEDAVRPICHLLNNTEVSIIVAKENVQQRHGILSIEESAAIQLYTMETLPVDRCLYYVLNRTLRSANRRDLIPWFSYLKLLMTGLWKLPSVRRTVWRGIKNVDLSEQYKEGQRYTWWNLSSCTETLTVMQQPWFLGNDGLRTLFSIECENGKQIKEYSYSGHENEILLPPATYFEVVGKVNPALDLYIIHVRQIAPPYELISPPF